MKSKFIPITLIFLIIIIALVLALFFIFGNNNSNVDKIIENENVQIAVLTDIYVDVLSTINTDDGNIVLDNSALKNILTNEDFSEEGILKLKSVEKTNEDTNITYTIYSKYLSTTHTLSIEIIKDGTGYMKHTQKYTLSVDNGKINFERDELGETVIE